jgi:outer membrane protein TolC
MTSRQKKLRLFAAIAGVALTTGCSFNSLFDDCRNTCYTPTTVPTPGPAAMAIETPCLDETCLAPWQEFAGPLDISEEAISEENSLSLTLEQCIQMALSNAEVLRDLGGTVVRSPNAIGTSLDPAMIFTDPRFGQEAALAEFDATLTAALRFENNDRAFNNAFVGNTGLFKQDFHNYNWGVTKRSATGGQYTFRHVTLYDNNNQLSNRLGASTFESFLEGEIRHPLMQGAGTEFNRIAGPNGQPGNINGVLIARVRQDISLAEFQRNLRDLVADVENAYWDLYFAYRDLEAKIEVRDQAFEVSKEKKAKAQVGIAGDDAQAAEQYYRFQAEVVNSINGRPIDATRTNNGTSGGTFRAQGGLRVAERRLRLMIGSEINDGRIIRPADYPTEALITYDWNSAIGEAMSKREELRRQRWVIKQRELELIANRNFIKPRVDIVGTYRLRGFGDKLANQGGTSNAFGNMADGDLQEFAGGVEVLVPVGFRQANAAVRNSQQTLARERAILREQERFIHFGLSNAFSELRRSFDNRQLQLNRLEETQSQITELRGRDDSPLDVLLEAQRRLLDIKLSYHQAEIEYVLAIRNIQLEKGTLLEFCNVFLSESAWPNEAYRDANERNRNKGPAKSPAERDPIVGVKTNG